MMIRTSTVAKYFYCLNRCDDYQDMCAGKEKIGVLAEHAYDLSTTNLDNRSE